ncbi:MAG TPA: DOMON-like domain-containing protein [Caulobacteraceae bacterium]
MRQALTIHPGSLCTSVSSIAVDAARPSPGVLELSFGVIGAVNDLYLPPTTTPARTEELWRRTCFEAFVRAAKGDAYIEINLSPSGEWAAYRFSGHRAGMRVASEVAAPRFAVRQTDDCLKLRASVDLGTLSESPSNAVWHLALSAVIEEAGGRKSYWALAHPPGRPDFHAEAGFVYELAPPEA